jgi:hypothetical protein
MKNDLSRGLRDRLINALKGAVIIYQGWNAFITFLGALATTYLIFILHKQFILQGTHTIFSLFGLFFFVISNILFVILSFLVRFLLNK